MSDKNILEQVKLICKTQNIRPERSKGQNFLINTEVIDKIISASGLKKDDVVLEVGPGLGILTEGLTSKAGRVISVELDKKLFGYLQVKFLKAKNLKLVNDDILKINPKNLGLKQGHYKIIANLPYNITSIFLRTFMSGPNRPSDMTLLLQKEVAQRICAGSGDSSLLSISIQLYGRPEIIEIVPKKDFYPVPEIDSAILKISDIKSKREVDKFLGNISDDDFWRVVRISFSAKRKQLQNNLSSGLKISAENIKKLLKEANFDPQVRAQNLDVNDYVRLTAVLTPLLPKKV